MKKRGILLLIVVMIGSTSNVYSGSVVKTKK